MNDDAALLRRYATDGAQDAFAELVRRHLGLVYHAALRQIGGDPHRAQEVAQIVFTDLARKAAVLVASPHLVAWLHTATRLAATQLRRSEARRLAREHAAFAMNADELGGGFGTDAGAVAPESAADWERLRPFIDEALETLGDRDRAAVLLRFFENRSYAEVAAALSVSDDAARVRVNRALEKLRATLARRGLVSTATALGLALTQPALAATPPGLAASVTTASLSAAAAATAATATGASVGGAGGALSATATAATTTAAVVMSTAKIALTTAGALALLSVGVVLYQRQPSSSDLLATHHPLLDTSLSPADLEAILRPARLSAADADAALAAYLALPLLVDPAPAAELRARRARLRALLTVLPESHFERFLTILYGRVGWAEDELRRIAFTAWAQQAPEAADRWAEALVPTPTLNLWQRARLVSEATGLWARIDFDAAHAWAGTIADVPLGQGITVEILAQLARSQPDRALAVAPVGEDKFARDARLAIFRAWGKKDPAGALRRLGPAIYEENKNNYEASAQRAVPQVLAIWAAKDPDAALAWALAQPSPPPEDSHRTALQTLGSELDEIPGAMRPFIDKIVARADLPGREGVLKSLFASWALRDAREALAWVDTVPDQATRSELVSWSLSLIGNDNPDEFLEAVRKLPDAGQRTERIADRLAAWAEKDAAAALAWLDRHDDPELAAATGRVEGVLLGKLAASDPAAALARWQAIPPGAARAQAALPLATAWGRTDPAAAARWLVALPSDANGGGGTSDPALDKVLRSVASRWSLQDPLSFVAWAETIPDATRRDAVLGTLGFEYFGDVRDPGFHEALNNRIDPPPRVAYAAQLSKIENPALREKGLTAHLRGWIHYDYQAARAWMESHDALSPEAAARLLTEAESR